MEATPRNVPAPARPGVDLLLGVLGGGMVLLALVSAVTGRGQPGDGEVAPPAVVSVLSPAEGDTLDHLSVVFRTDAAIQPRPGGWGTPELHLHLQLGRQELMAGPDALVRLPSGAYRWDVGDLPPGPQQLRFYWSDANHRAVEGGGSGVVRVEGR